MDDATLPAPAGDLTAVIGGEMSLGMKIMLNTALYERCKDIARHMAAAEGFVPKHLVGRTAACFAVVTRALTWRLDPYAVAQSTYETPGGRVGYEGKLVQAILENSGRIEGGIQFRHYGDWSRVMGKWVLAKGSSGKDYAKATWTREDAKGLGVTVIAKVKGEPETREWDVDLEQALGSLNSTLWATDPKTQLCYFAARRFANVRMPGVLMGVPFDFDPPPDDTPPMRDVTPRAARARPKEADLDDWAERKAKATEPVEDAPVEDPPAEDAPAQDAPAEDPPAHDADSESPMVTLSIPGGKQGVMLTEKEALGRLETLVANAPSAGFIRQVIDLNPWLSGNEAFTEFASRKAEAMLAAGNGKGRK